MNWLTLFIGILSLSVFAQSPHDSIKVTYTIKVDCSVLQTFNYVTKESVLPEVLLDFQSEIFPIFDVPGVRSTELLNDSWAKSGDSRIVFLNDGNTAKEKILEKKIPRHYSYQVNEFSGQSSKLISHAVGDWEFSEGADYNNSTTLVWTYIFYSKGYFQHKILSKYVDLGWKPYMRRALFRTKNILEGNDCNAYN